MAEDDPQPPLDYRNPGDDRRHHAGSVAAFCLGLFAGIALVLGCVFAVIVHALDKGLESTTRQTAPTGFNPAVLVFGFIAAISIGVGLLLLRQQPRRFMLIGFLIGFGLGSIIEGTCFAR